MSDHVSGKMSRPMSDDAFAARLREVTANVPPSSLDLDAVAASSRRKARRYQMAVGTCCVAAVAAAGIGVPQALTLLPDGGSSIRGELAVGPAANRDLDAQGGTCDPADVKVSWRSEDLQRVVAWAERTAYDGSSTATDEVVPYDRERSAPSVSGPGIDAQLEAVILREAAETEGSGLELPQWSVPDFPDVSALQLEPRPALQGFGGAGAELTVQLWFESLEDPAPGTYLFYRAGDEHLVAGIAECGDARRSFVLSYWVIDESGAVECATPIDDATGIRLKRAYCDGGLTKAERATIGLDPDQPASVADADEAARQLRIAATGG